MFFLVCSVLLAYSNLARAEDALQPKSIFILAGQSNMAGRGGVVNDTWDGVVPPECQANPLVFRLNAALTWEEAREPLHRDIDVEKTCGVGPGMAFSTSALKRDPGIGVIGLVPCAIGGTNISEWRRGGRLYSHLMTRAQAALRGGGGLIRAVLWYQGESDTINHEDARLYKRRLERFFNDVRSDLLSPVLPIIQVALASGQGPYVDIIRKAQLGINLPNVRCVDAYGLQLEPDGLHLSTRAQVRLGRMLADAFLHIMAPLPVQSSGANKRFHNFFLDFFLRYDGLVSSHKPSNFFILAGQSNPAGQGGIITNNQWDEVVPLQNKTGMQINAELILEEARDPLHHEIGHSLRNVLRQRSSVGKGSKHGGPFPRRVGPEKEEL